MDEMNLLRIDKLKNIGKVFVYYWKQYQNGNY